MSVADRLHIATNNIVENFTLSSDVAAESAYPLTNMQNKNANEEAVIDMTSDTDVTISLPGSVDYTINSFALWNHNLPSDVTVQLLLYPDASYGGTPYDSTALSVYHTIPWGAFMAGDPWAGYFEETSNLKTGLALYFDEQTFKSAKIIISGSTFTNNEISIDKLWLAPSYVFDYGPARSSKFSIVDNSIHQPKPGGGMETVEREAYRKLDFDFSDSQDTEAILISHLLEKAKLSGDIFLSMEPNNLRGNKYYRTGIFRRTNDMSFTSAYYNGNSHKLSVVEN